MYYSAPWRLFGGLKAPQTTPISATGVVPSWRKLKVTEGVKKRAWEAYEVAAACHYRPQLRSLASLQNTCLLHTHMPISSSNPEVLSYFQPVILYNRATAPLLRLNHTLAGSPSTMLRECWWMALCLLAGHLTALLQASAPPLWMW